MWIHAVKGSRAGGGQGPEPSTPATQRHSNFSSSVSLTVRPRCSAPSPLRC